MTTADFETMMRIDEAAGDYQRLRFREQLLAATDHHLDRAPMEWIFGKEDLRGTTGVITRRERLAAAHGLIAARRGPSVVTEYDDDNGRATGAHIDVAAGWLGDPPSFGVRQPAVTQVGTATTFAVYQQPSYVMLGPGGLPSDEQWLAAGHQVADQLSMPDGTLFVVTAHADHAHLSACPLDIEWFRQQQEHLQELLSMGVLTSQDYHDAIQGLVFKQM